MRLCEVQTDFRYGKNYRFVQHWSQNPIISLLWKSSAGRLVSLGAFRHNLYATNPLYHPLYLQTIDHQHSVHFSVRKPWFPLDFCLPETEQEQKIISLNFCFKCTRSRIHTTTETTYIKMSNYTITILCTLQNANRITSCTQKFKQIPLFTGEWYRECTRRLLQAL